MIKIRFKNGECEKFNSFEDAVLFLKLDAFVSASTTKEYMSDVKGRSKIMFGKKHISFRNEEEFCYELLRIKEFLEIEVFNEGEV
jgi:hypothetical protein